MRKNRWKLTVEFATRKTRRVESSLFGFSDRQTLVSYVPRKNKVVVLLWTMHNDNKADADKGLPIMILDYNATKAAVDKVDQLCHNYSELKRTKRWSLAYFYNCLNIAGINSMVVFWAKFPGREKEASHRRRIFLENLGISLLHPWLQRWVQEKQLPSAAKLSLQKCGYKIDTDSSQTSAAHEGGKRKRRRCHICPSSLDRKTPHVCEECNEPRCIDHQQVTVLCSYCASWILCFTSSWLHSTSEHPS